VKEERKRAAPARTSSGSRKSGHCRSNRRVKRGKSKAFAGALKIRGGGGKGTMQGKLGAARKSVTVRALGGGNGKQRST